MILLPLFAPGRLLFDQGVQSVYKGVLYDQGHAAGLFGLFGLFGLLELTGVLELLSLARYQDGRLRRCCFLEGTVVQKASRRR